MKKHIAIATLLAAALASSASLAQSASGQVKKIDEAAGKLTLDHGPIKKLDMGAMTMVYRVKDPALLKGLKAGDKVKFEADKIDDQYIVTSIHKSK
jgi:Cu(I)/Ag(I) efflux system periplasmic protein CusF